MTGSPTAGGPGGGHETTAPVERILGDLRERAKELDCLYKADELLSRYQASPEDVFGELVQSIPQGWQFPEVCCCRLRLSGTVYQTPGFYETPWIQKATVRSHGEKVGDLQVVYLSPRPTADEGPFLREERRLLDTLAERIGYSLVQRELHRMRTGLHGPESGEGSWSVIIQFLRTSDPSLLRRLAQRILTHLQWHGLAKPEDLVDLLPPQDEMVDENRPLPFHKENDLADRAQRSFSLAASILGEKTLLGLLQSWVDEERSRFLLDTLANSEATLERVSSALARFRSQGADEERLPAPIATALRVGLVNRFLSDQTEFVRQSAGAVRVSDFYALTERIVDPERSHGRVGGKTAGLFVAWNILRRASEKHPELKDIRVPNAWVVPSDALLAFLEYNGFGTLHTLKYKSTEEIRQDHPNLIEAFRNSPLPPSIRRGLAMALDDLGQVPLVVRSSSLLEDRPGSSFAGKYRSLFLANQGPREERLEALERAITEIYASVFSPDPIGYRAERGLLDFHEEMSVLIQQVVGTRIGRYHMPSFAGVAFSRNELRWSPRIQREDGLLRLVPGLGTRAVDRLADDYPVLLAPRQPQLRVNQTPDEVMRYSPRRVDLLDLEANDFCTRPLDEVLRECGNRWPLVHRLLSRVDEDILRPVSPLELDFRDGDYVVTFDGLIAQTDFVRRVALMLQVLEETLGHPVDLEFAHDGTDFYLLQCRNQSFSADSDPDVIPADLPASQVLFSARRYVSNGRAPEITHVVYVDPEAYHALDPAAMREVGRAVGRLNGMLPRRKFALLGPGRWGSRGDIRLGVPVTYADINHAAIMIEIARQTGDYVPDLSFGTHFFQDLVEAGIRYLPLYPDDPDVAWQGLFFQRSDNILGELLPSFAYLSEVLRVIDVPRQTDGQVLRILCNAEQELAVGVLCEPGATGLMVRAGRPGQNLDDSEHWKWRMHMAERLAASLDGARMGVRALYVIGGTKNGTAGPGSDVDLLAHFVGTPEQREALLLWLGAWSRALAAMNHLRTGYVCTELLDVHLVDDQALAAGGGFASKIHSIDDPAQELEMASRA